MLNNKIITSLLCPNCKGDVHVSDNMKSLLCNGKKQHCFDFASSGYINLSGASLSGDSKEAVRARKTFLDAGHYKAFSDSLNEIVKNEFNDPFIADMGCGEGYYSVNMLKSIPASSLVGFDLSKYAVESAAKLSRREGVSDRALFSASSIFSPPLKDDSCDVILNLFAPCCEAEFCRLLKNDGILIVVGAGKDHLIELKSILYDIPRRNDERKDLPAAMTLIDKRDLSYKFIPSKEERNSLFEMTPYFYRTSDSDKQKLESAPIIPITAEFNIFIYRKTTT